MLLSLCIYMCNTRWLTSLWVSYALRVLLLSSTRQPAVVMGKCSALSCALAVNDCEPPYSVSTMRRYLACSLSGLGCLGLTWQCPSSARGSARLCCLLTWLCLVHCPHVCPLRGYLAQLLLVHRLSLSLICELPKLCICLLLINIYSM